MNAVDSNVFIYALDNKEPAKQAKARALLDQLVQPATETRLLWQVAGEVLSCLRKWESAGRITPKDVEAHFQNLLDMFPLCLPNAELFRTSFELRARFSLSHWDSMLLAACKTCGATTLYSEDMAGGMIYDGVTIVNPFV